MAISIRHIIPRVSPELEVTMLIFCCDLRYFNWLILSFSPFRGNLSLFILINSNPIFELLRRVISSHSTFVSLSLNGLTILMFVTIFFPCVLTEDGMIKYLDVARHWSGIFSTPDPTGRLTIVVESGQINVTFILKDVEYIQPRSVRLTSGRVNAGPKCLIQISVFVIPLNRANAQLLTSAVYKGLSIGHTNKSS